MPEHNFSMNDLDSDIRDKLLAEKPDLGDAWDMYTKEGMTKRVLNRINNGLANNDLDGGTYEPEEKRFLVHRWRDFDDFIGDLYDDDLKKILEIAKGEADFQHEHVNIDAEFAETLLERPDQWKEKIVAKVGLSRIDDEMMADAARHLINTNDDLFQLFHDVCSAAKMASAIKPGRVYMSTPKPAGRMPVVTFGTISPLMMKRPFANLSKVTNQYISIFLSETWC